MKRHQDVSSAYTALASTVSPCTAARPELAGAQNCCRGAFCKPLQRCRIGQRHVLEHANIAYKTKVPLAALPFAHGRKLDLLATSTAVRIYQFTPTRPAMPHNQTEHTQRPAVVVKTATASTSSSATTLPPPPSPLSVALGDMTAFVGAGAWCGL
jgi:hypothetical protein